eukprot:Sspe_Gene.114132::Locus_99602_Transcript_1_1_Confidence_1.000_Length_817::g.114132::m.114132
MASSAATAVLGKRTLPPVLEAVCDYLDQDRIPSVVKKCKTIAGAPVYAVLAVYKISHHFREELRYLVLLPVLLCMVDKRGEIKRVLRLGEIAEVVIDDDTRCALIQPEAAAAERPWYFRWVIFGSRANTDFLERLQFARRPLAQGRSLPVTYESLDPTAHELSFRPYMKPPSVKLKKWKCPDADILEQLQISARSAAFVLEEKKREDEQNQAAEAHAEVVFHHLTMLAFKQRRTDATLVTVLVGATLAAAIVGLSLE